MSSRQTLDRIDGLKIQAGKGNFPTPGERRAKLRLLRKVFCARGDAALAALCEDSGRSETEALFSELIPLAWDLRRFAANVKRWSAPRRERISLLNLPGRAFVVSAPRGVVLITAPWDLPLLRTLHLAAGAYAAGNKVVVKLSERSRRSMEFLRWLLEECFSPEELIVADDELSLDELLRAGFDYIFPADTSLLARIAPEAARRLTPFSPERGGKSPCIVHNSADLRSAARRICRAKFFNAGQYQSVPELLIVEKTVRGELLAEIQLCLREFYGENPLENMQGVADEESYERIIRLTAHGRLVTGGGRAPARRALEPTLIDRLPPDASLWKEEIQGPVLPVIEYTSAEELFVLLGRLGPSPALYFFGDAPELRKELARKSPAACIVFNDAGVQHFNRALPSGGAGASARLNGRFTFETFSLRKQIMARSELFNFSGLFPPYSRRFFRFLARLSGLRLKK